MGRFFKVVLLGLLLGTIAGCTASISRTNGLLSRLNGRGPVALSPDNPYIVGNLALAREVESSPVLRGFIAHRGSPPALEVTRPLFNPYRITLYYPDKPEQYSFEQSGDEWIIDGPEQIEREKLKELVLLTRNSADGEAKLLTGSELSAPQENPPVTLEPAEEIPVDPVPAPQARAERHTAAPGTSFQSPADVAPLGGVRSEREIVALAEAHGAHPAEITAKGDLVHYVTMSGDNLSMIARWYTYDRANAGRLARINGIKDPDSVTIGDTVIVPAYLVRNKNRMTKEGLELMKSIAADLRSTAPSPKIPGKKSR